MEEYYREKITFMRKKQAIWEEKLKMKKEKNEIQRGILCAINEIKDVLF